MTPQLRKKALSLVAKAWLTPLYFLRPLRQQTTLFFGLEGVVTSPNDTFSTNAAGTALDLTVLLKSGFKGGYKIIASEHWKDADGFEQWCRNQGLLIEINDADYAEPKLAVAN